MTTYRSKMIIQEDTRQKPSKNADIRKQLEALGHTVRRFGMLCGDYQIFGKGDVVIDTKQDMQEVYSNVITDHERFANEARLAREAGIRLIILVTDPIVSSIDDVRLWRNPRRERWFMVKAMQRKGKMLTVKQSKTPPCASDRLQKAMVTMTLRYGITWLFCKRENVGEEIIRLLTEEY